MIYKLPGKERTHLFVLGLFVLGVFSKGRWDLCKCRRINMHKCMGFNNQGGIFNNITSTSCCVSIKLSKLVLKIQNSFLPILFWCMHVNIIDLPFRIIYTNYFDSVVEHTCLYYVMCKHYLFIQCNVIKEQSVVCSHSMLVMSNTSSGS